ncbi:MAG: ABC transporter permease [Nitrosomonas sp.]|uniref:ABC transporter permease n=1 Tax=Nitrosomonas sp. TaxID=42353 RepID=UPI002B38ABDD|nr:ABC transporter permease [Nitrosomonas sp.]MEB2332129.1 ABC transporter permease [Nitrosomonas sp.]
MLKLAFRNIFRSPLRTSLTLAAIITGVVTIIISGGFIEDVFVQLRESTIHSHLGHIQVFQHGYQEYGRREPSRYMIRQPDNVIDTISHIPHVQAVMMRANFSGLVHNGRADLPVIGEGIEPDKEAQLGSAITITAGRLLQDSDKFGAIVGEGVASALNLHAGDYITLMANTLNGALNTLECEIVGIFRTFSKEYDDRAIHIHLLAAQELLDTESVHGTIVLLDNTDKTDQVISKIAAALASQNYEIKAWWELADFYQKTEALYRRQFGALQVIIFTMLALSIASTVNMTVYERTGEFGTMLALGSRQRQVFMLVLLENTLLGLFGSLLGMIIGITLASIVSGIGITMPPPPGSNIGYIASIRLVTWGLIAAMLTGILASIAAAILPARRASMLQITDALRYNI